MNTTQLLYPVYIKQKKDDVYFCIHEDGRFIRVSMEDETNKGIEHKIYSLSFGLHHFKDQKDRTQFVERITHIHLQINKDTFFEKIAGLENTLNQFTTNWIDTNPQIEQSPYEEPPYEEPRRDTFFLPSNTPAPF